MTGTAKLSNRAQHPARLGPTRFDADDLFDGELTGLNHSAERVQPQIHVENGSAVDRRNLADRVRCIL